MAIFSDAKFKELPKAIYRLSKLERLFCDASKSHYRLPLNMISEDLGKLSNLKRLCISNTSIETLPESIGELKNLEICLSSDNKLKTIPASFFLLNNIQTANFASNKIANIPTLPKTPPELGLGAYISFQHNFLSSQETSLLRGFYGGKVLLDAQKQKQAFNFPEIGKGKTNNMNYTK